MQKKIVNFELDKHNLKMKDILDKEFVEIQVYAISDANPNRNGSCFTLESMSQSLDSFKNKPILGAWSIKGDDFKSHNGNLQYDSDLESLYWDYTQPGCETPLGTIRESDNIEILFDEQRNEHWIVVNAVLWSRYAYNPIKKLLRKNGRAKISVEIEVNKSHYDDNGIEIIEDFTFNGLTILGKENGVEVEEGIENAHLNVLQLMENALFQKKCKALAFAYNTLDREIGKNLIDTQSNLSSNIQSIIDDQSLSFSSDVISNEKQDEITMQSNEEKEEEVQMNQDEKAKETESCATCEKCSKCAKCSTCEAKCAEGCDQYEEMACGEKEQESCGTCSKCEKCAKCSTCETKCSEGCDQYEEMSCGTCAKEEDMACGKCSEEEPSKEEDMACGTCAKEEEACGKCAKEEEACGKCAKEEDMACGDKETEGCATCEKCEADGSCDDGCGDCDDDDKDDRDDDEEDFSQEGKQDSKEFAASIDPSAEPNNLNLEGKSTDQIINETTASIKAPESGREAAQFGEASIGANAEMQVFTPAIDQVKEGESTFEIDSSISAGPNGEQARVVSESGAATQADLMQPNDKEKEKIFSVLVDGEELDINSLQEKYVALKEKYDALKHQVDVENISKLIDSAKEFVSKDQNLNQSIKEDFINQVSAKCESFELTEEDEVLKFTKSLLAMYYYENILNNNNSKENDFSISIQKNSHVDNNIASSNKLRDAMNKLNKV